MKTIVLAGLVILLPIWILAEGNGFDLLIAREKAEHDRTIARTYAVAIAVAGACIGAGIFFGLRQSRRDERN